MCKGIGLLLGILLLTSVSFSQVEFTAFGLYNFNVSFSSEGDVNSIVESEVSSWYPEYQAFFSTVLEQQNGTGLGGRIAYNFTPSTGFEFTVESISAPAAFNEGLIDNLKDRLQSTGYSNWLEISNQSGGNIIRYYGNLVFNFPSSSPITPYASFGLGLTQFKLGEGVGPELDIISPDSSERFHLYYLDSTELTFNGALGAKVVFSSHIGLRLDARIFVCDPDFEQRISTTSGGFVLFDDIGSVIQGGTHIDTNLNLGLFVKF